MRRAHNFIDLTGRFFGRLTVKEFKGKNDKGRVLWLCICSCSNKTEKIITGNDLKSGNTKSCGCLNIEVATESNKKQWNPVDRGDYYDIPLNNNFYTKIDKEDLYKIRDMGWTIYEGTVRPYAICTYKCKNILMHRIIMDCVNTKVEVDHINHDTLDNRKANLRLCDHSHNLRNRIISSNNTSGYHGVYYDKKKKKWYGRIIVNDKCIFLGYHVEKEKAILDRKNAEIEYFGEFRNKTL
jgi:peptide methionine sulfoxide reductase MsrB